MTTLQQRALARVAMTRETVEDVYTGRQSGTDKQCIRGLCESHERLRAEIQGAEVLLEENRQEITSVLALMDNLASVWGDESVFRRCRDRLRKLVGGEDAPQESRYCDECERQVESHAWRQIEEDEVCRQLCHRHFQE